MIAPSRAMDAGAAERGFAVAGLITLSGAFFPLLRTEAPGAGQGAEADTLRWFVLLALYAVTAVLLLRSRHEALLVVIRAPLTIGLVVLAAASAAWSATPQSTLERSAALAGSTLFALYLAGRFSGRELATLVSAALGVAAVASLLVALFLPDLGVSSGVHEGAWRGVFVEKNTFGRAMTLATVTFVILAGTRSHGVGAQWILAVLCGGLVLLSQSTSALAVLLVLLSAVWLVRLFRARHALRVPMLLVLLTGALLSAGGADEVMAIFGKNASLSGRVELWSWLARMIGHRMWLGYGYDGFWRAGPQAEEVYGAIGWEAWHAHNGLLELGLSLGIAGVALFVTAYIACVRRAWRSLPLDGESAALWGIIFLIFLALSNLTESSILEQNNLLWVLFVATASMRLTSMNPAAAPVPGTAPVQLIGPLSPGIARRRRALAPSEGG